MKKMIFLFLLIFLFQLLSAQGFELSFWNNIRNSSYTVDNELHIRCETLELPGLETEIFYTTQEGWESEEMQQFSGFTYEAIIPALLGETQYCRFRTETDTLVGMMPTFISDDIFPPGISELSLVADDPIGDVLVEDAPHLDIIREYFGYSDSRFYSAISNNDGDFPTDSGGFFPDEFYFYTTTIFNPENVLIDSVVYCLIYADIPMVMDPGLYRVTGTEISLESFEWIGDIETVIIDSTLIMACNIETLTNDEYFGEWPNLSNTLGLEFLTCQLTLPSEFLFADFSILSFQNIDQYIIEPFTNILPGISNLGYLNANGYIFYCTYSDENGHFPIITELEVNGNTYAFSPDSFDFSSPVEFYTGVVLEDWDEATFRFSD
ncbi:MAG: hypothetical protein KAT74_05625, partial [Candidatus Cloacimonetes bacterium]|nr:hypothetical protein [Candidatus Cloacimonadota bacterium]